MQFNSYIFILVFMPVTTLLYYQANKTGILAGKLVIIASSAAAVVISGGAAMVLLPVSMLVNYAFAYALAGTKGGTPGSGEGISDSGDGTSASLQDSRGKMNRQACLFIPVAVNIGLLIYYKYTNFLIGTWNGITGFDIALRDIALPVGISFFTFQQIAFLVWAGKREGESQISFIDYAAYILYFPKLQMGPLMEPEDFFEQINDPARRTFSYENMAGAVKIFSLGLFKKALIADTFAAAVSWGYGNIDTATGMDLLIVMLSYTFELYFDFSGYCDMAVGASQMLGITLPINFDSPYKALSARDLWKRWHITLTSFFTKYIYIPLGGSRRGRIRTYVNTMIVFLISGLWHGANWTYVLWGGCYGLLMVFERMFPDVQDKIIKPLRWLTTFGLFSILAFIVSSESVSQWLDMLRRIVTMKNMELSEGLLDTFYITEMKYSLGAVFTSGAKLVSLLIWLALALGICLIPENNYRTRNRLSVAGMLGASVLFWWALLSLGGDSTFVYYGF